MSEALVLSHSARPPSEVTLEDVERERAILVLSGKPGRQEVLNMEVFRKILEHPLELLHGWRTPQMPQGHVWRSPDAVAPREAWWLVGQIELVPRAEVNTQFIIGMMFQCLKDAHENGQFHQVPPRQNCNVNVQARHPMDSGIVLLWGWTVPAEIGMTPW